MSTPSIKVMLLSTDPALADLPGRIVAKFPDVEITETAANWAALAASPHLPGSIVLVDAELGGAAISPDLIKAIRAAEARAITLSGVDSPAGVMRAMAAGADAALRKSDSSRRVGDQLRLAANRDQLIRQRSN